jgi:MFS family permease
MGVHASRFGSGARAWALIGLISASQMLISLDITLLGVLLPSIGKEFALGAGAQGGLLSFYALVFGGLLLVAGKCADIVGQRICCLAGLGIFGLGTILAAAAPDYGTLLAARIVQGVGAAVLVPSNFSLINTTIPDGPQRRRAYGVFGMVQGIALLLGPAGGGLLAAHFGWRAAFAAVLGLVVALFIVGLELLPRRPTARPTERLDVIGAAVFVPSIIALILGISGGPAAMQDTSLRFWLCSAGIAGLGAFVLIEKKASSPLLPLGLFRQLTTVTGLLGMIAVMAAASALFLLPNLVMQRVMGWSPAQSGLGMIPHAVATIGMGQLIGYLLGKLTLNRNILLGFSLLICGTLLNSFMRPGGGYLFNVMLPMLFSASGSVLTIMALTAEVTLPIEPERQGVISALAFTCQQIGISLGAVVILAVANAGDDLLASYGSAFLTASALAFSGLCASLFAKVLLRRLPGRARQAAG